MATPRPLKAAIDVAVVGFRSAGDVGLLPPGVNIVMGIVNSIVENCEQVRSHQQECKELSRRATALFEALRTQTQRLSGTPLETSVEDVKKKLDVIQRQTSVWASYGFWRAFRYDAVIADGLKTSIKQIEEMTQLFQIDVMTYIAQLVHALAKDKGLQSNLPTDAEKIVKQACHNPESLKTMDPQTLKDIEPILWQCINSLYEQSEQKQIIINGQLFNRITFNQMYICIQEGLRNVHHVIDMPPDVEILNGHVKKDGIRPHYGGVVSDIYKGTFLGKDKVAIKSLRNLEVANQRETKRFDNEMAVWRRLKHPNILNFLGYCTDLGEKISLITPWMEGSDLWRYCSTNPQADRLSLLIDAARGIQYLHQKNIVHGNLKCAKILVDVPDFSKGQNGAVRALVGDFQMAKILDEVSHSPLGSVTVQGSARWVAPEFTTSAKTQPSADIYSFSMTMFECFTLFRPFDKLRRNNEVMKTVLDGGRPERPGPGENPWITNSLWKLMEDGWQGEPTKRPTIDEVLSRLEEARRARRAYLGH